MVTVPEELTVPPFDTFSVYVSLVDPATNGVDDV
jgi:hypothetical protein